LIASELSQRQIVVPEMAATMPDSTGGAGQVGAPPAGQRLGRVGGGR
jgi:hypothetical protein